jgi:hypothetical protein
VGEAGVTLFLEFISPKGLPRQAAAARDLPAEAVVRLDGSTCASRGTAIPAGPHASAPSGALSTAAFKAQNEHLASSGATLALVPSLLPAAESSALPFEQQFPVRACCGTWPRSG